MADPVDAQRVADRLTAESLEKLENPKRQLEVLTMARDIFIRMGTIGEPEQAGRITGQLSATEARKLSRALDDALARIGQA